jgi:hypothetical protein
VAAPSSGSRCHDPMHSPNIDRCADQAAAEPSPWAAIGSRSCGGVEMGRGAPHAQGPPGLSIPPLGYGLRSIAAARWRSHGRRGSRDDGGRCVQRQPFVLHVVWMHGSAKAERRRDDRRACRGCDGRRRIRAHGHRAAGRRSIAPSAVCVRSSSKRLAASTQKPARDSSFPRGSNAIGRPTGRRMNAGRAPRRRKCHDEARWTPRTIALRPPFS